MDSPPEGADVVGCDVSEKSQHQFVYFSFVKILDVMPNLD